MLRFGICTQKQFLAAGERRRFSGSRVSYGLLDIGENPTKEQIQIFEDINFTLLTSNGSYRTTFRQRFQDVNATTQKILEQLYSPDAELLVEDRAVSHGLTSLEWAHQLFHTFPYSKFEASDRLLYLVQLSLASGAKYILEPQGRQLQYITQPFVVGLCHNEFSLFPLNRLIAVWAKRRLAQLSLPTGWMDSSGGDGYQVSKIGCVHPEVLVFSRADSRFQLRTRSIFDVTPSVVDVVRTMNILNEAYFSHSQLMEGSRVVFESLKLGGVWIVGRTMETDFSNHVTIMQKQEHGWKILDRIGKGSEMERYTDRVQTGTYISEHQ